MAQSPISLLLLRRLTTSLNPKPWVHPLLLSLKPYSTTTTSSTPDPATTNSPSSLSARMSFIFDQIDAIERERVQKDETFQRIRAWRESKNSSSQPPENQTPETTITAAQNPEIIAPEIDGLEYDPSDSVSSGDFEEAAEKKKELEVVHPWPEWIELMETLVRQNYFDHRRKGEGKMAESLELDDNVRDGNDDGDGDDDIHIDFRSFKAVQTACLNFGKDRFDILRSLSKQDIQLLVGYGCPNAAKGVVFSAKVLRKQVHLNEGDVCSNCSLRSSCEKAFLLTNKEDEARTVDVMRILLNYGFEPINGLVANKSLLKQKGVKTAVRKLLHQVVKLSAVPIDPNLPPPVIKRPPPKVKQPPPPPKKRVGRDDIEMKKGDWLCPKCDFMNFAKNIVCLQCDAKRPKRQLLPGEWECPQCNFLNYRRNMTCFHCECNRPHDAFIENNMEDKHNGPATRVRKIANRAEVSNAWNFDFDDNESDGADVAAFEYADSAAMREDSSLGGETRGGNFRGQEDDPNIDNKFNRAHEREYSEPDYNRPGMGFDDFDDEDYELQNDNNTSPSMVFQGKFSRERTSELHVEGPDDSMHAQNRRSPPAHKKPLKHTRRKADVSDFEDDEQDINLDEELSVHPKWKSSHVADARHNRSPRPLRGPSFGSDEELESDADYGFGSGQRKGNRWGSGGKKFQQSSDLEDDFFSGLESDQDDLNYRGNRSGGNKSRMDKRGSNSPRHGDLVSEREGRFKGMGDRRNSRSNDFDRSSRGNHGRERRFRGNQGGHDFVSDRDVRFKDEMSHGSNSWDDDFHRSSHGNHGRGGRSQSNSHDLRRINDRGGDRWNKKASRQEGFQNQRGRSHDYDKDKVWDQSEFRNSRRVIER